jgi:galactokinase
VILKNEVRHKFRDRFGAWPDLVVRSPGRVNLIGEHTDYNDGYVLPMAIDRAIWLAIRSRDDRSVHVHSLQQSDACEFSLDELSPGASGWSEYLKGMAKFLQEEGHRLVGWDGVMSSDIPMASGLSSSAAIEMAVGLAFAELSKFPFDGMVMARIGQRVENDWIGAKTGIMDQMICANGKAGSALLLDCRDLTSQTIALPSDSVVFVLDTMTRHDHRTSGYGDRRSSCEAAAAFFGVSHLRDVCADDLESRGSSGLLDTRSLQCARHVVSENARVLAAAEAMRQNAAVELGRLMDASHASLRDDFQVSTDELNLMVELARTQPGCLGARMTGGGFGGCAIALVEEAKADKFASSVSEKYQSATRLAPDVFVTRPVSGTSIVQVDAASSSRTSLG